MKPIIACLAVLFLAFSAYAQNESVFRLMQRTDLRVSEIVERANRCFARTGRGRGTGYKQFMRWLEEMKYRTDANGYIIDMNEEWQALQRARPGLRPASASAVRLNTWRDLGPDTWSATTGWNPGMGRVFAFAIHPSDTNTVYLATDGGGLWKSTQGGLNWQPLTNDEPRLARAMSLAIAPSSPNIIYAGEKTNGLFKSADAGNTWVKTSLSLGRIIRKILVHPSNPDIVLAACEQGGIFRSTDGGGAWTRVHQSPKEDLEFKPGNPNTIYASGDGELANGISPFWRSEDNGLTWTPIAASGLGADGRSLIAVSPANASIVYLARANGERFGRLYKSVNSGLSFTEVNNGNPAQGRNYFSYSETGADSSGIAHHAMALAVNPQSAQEIHLASPNSWQSLNGGVSFALQGYWHYPTAIAAGYGYHHADVHLMEWVGNSLYCASDGGFFKSVNHGRFWTGYTYGLRIRTVLKMSNSVTNSAVYATSAEDNGNSYHAAAGWRDFTGGDGVDCVISHANPNTIWACMQGGQTVRSTDGGLTIKGLTMPAVGAFSTPLAQHPADPSTIYIGLNGVYKSTNAGDTWTKISGNAIPEDLHKMVVAPSNPSYIYASTGANLYVTKNGGSSWANYTLPGTILSLAVSPANPERIWVALTGDNRIMRSANGGASFFDISNNLPAIMPRALLVLGNQSESVYVGMNFGMFYTDKSMNQWIEISDNLPAVTPSDIEFQPSASLIRVGTSGRGIWERDAYLPPCGQAANPQNVTVTYNTASIRWDSASGAIGYIIHYKGLNDPFFIQQSVGTATTASLHNLQQQTFYTWKVQPVCENGPGAFTILQSFITPPNPCAAPGNLTVGSVGIFGAGISWSAVPGALYYEVRYKRTSATTWTTAATQLTTTSYALIGLSQNTAYQVQVWAYCNTGSPNFSATQFTTLSLFGGTAIRNEAEASPQGVRVLPNPAGNRLQISADESWTPAARMEIMDMQGRIMMSGAYRQVVYTGTLAPGPYLLRLREGHRTVLVKWVRGE